MIKYATSFVFATLFLFAGTAQAATITGSGFITTVGADFVVISDSATRANQQVFYTPAVTTYLGGTTAPLKAWAHEYAVYTGTSNVDGSVSATNLTVYPAIKFVLAPIAAQVGVALADTNIMTSGTAPFTVTAFVTTAAQVAAAGLTGTVASYNVPAGMTISAAGILSGTPTTAGVYIIGVNAKDAIGSSVTSSFYIEVSDVTVVPPPSTGTGSGSGSGTSSDPVVPPAPTATPVTFVTSLANGQATVTYTTTNLISTGVAPFTVSASGVPAGMTVSATGALSGAPTTSGIYTITLSATDSVGTVGNGSVSITVVAAPVVVTTPAPTPTPTPAPTTGYTSTGKKVEAKGIVATCDTVSNIMTLTNGVVLRITATTKVKLNGYILSAVGRNAQYKGIKNTDSSVTLTSIEVN